MAGTRMPGTLVVALLLIATACGADFETVRAGESPAIDDETAGRPTDGSAAVGSFNPSWPEKVYQGDEFAVVISDVVGGPVSAQAAGSECATVEGQRYRALAVGICQITLTQEDSDTHRAADPMVISVQVESEPPDPLPVGSFKVTRPPSVTVGDTINIEINSIVGGAVSLAVLSRECRQTTSGRIVAERVGSCLIGADQSPSDTHRPGRSQVVEVTIVEAPPPDQATFTLSAPNPVEVGDAFTVTAENLKGIDATVDLRANGDCETLTGASIDSDNTLTLSATAVGACRVTASADPASGYLAPEPQLAVIEVRQPVGRFNVDFDSPIGVFDQVRLVPFDVVGGDISFRLDSGPCVWDSPFFYATGVGVCKFTATQDDHPDYRPAADLPIPVEVEKLPVVITIDAPPTAIVDSNFFVASARTVTVGYGWN